MTVLWRALRDAGLILPRAHGVNARDVEPIEAARVILAAMASESPAKAAERLPVLAGFVLGDLANEKPEFPEVTLERALASVLVQASRSNETAYELEVEIAGSCATLFAGPRGFLRPDSMLVQGVGGPYPEKLHVFRSAGGWTATPSIDWSEDELEAAMPLRGGGLERSVILNQTNLVLISRGLAENCEAWQ